MTSPDPVSDPLTSSVRAKPSDAAGYCWRALPALALRRAGLAALLLAGFVSAAAAQNCHLYVRPRPRTP